VPTGLASEGLRVRHQQGLKVVGLPHEDMGMDTAAGSVTIMRLDGIDDQLMFSNRLGYPAAAMRLEIYQYQSVEFFNQAVFDSRKTCVAGQACDRCTIATIVTEKV
jgi:hypothetical protein